MRPEGWEELKEAARVKAHIGDQAREDIFEAGADAYEEGLIKDEIIEIVDGKIQMCCPPDCMGMA